MKLKFTLIVFLSGALFVRGQGTFVWDQGFTNNITDAYGLLTNTPLGQPFTPTESSMDAAAFFLSVANLGTDGDVEIEVRNGSVTGAIIGTSNPETVVGSGGVYYFTFSSPVTLTPGAEYYLQPIEISGSRIAAQLGNVLSGGQATFGGVTYHDLNFWFEEGVQVVPEPSLAALFFIGGGIAYCHRRKRRVT